MGTFWVVTIELYLESLKSNHEEIPNKEGTLKHTLMVGINE